MPQMGVDHIEMDVKQRTWIECEICRINYMIDMPLMPLILPSVITHQLNLQTSRHDS